MNRNLFLLAMLTLSMTEILAQEDTTGTVSGNEGNQWSEPWLRINTNAVKVGASLGFNYLTRDVYVPVLSVVDNSLILQSVNPLSYLFSTNVVINPFGSSGDNQGKGQRKHRNLVKSISLIASVNLAQLGAQPGNFNTKLDGGLGLGYSISNDFHIGVTAEMIAVRQLRDYFVETYQNSPIILNNDTLNALDINDNRLFTDMYILGLSFKFIYILVGLEASN